MRWTRLSFKKLLKKFFFSGLSQNEKIRIQRKIQFRTFVRISSDVLAVSCSLQWCSKKCVSKWLRAGTTASYSSRSNKFSLRVLECFRFPSLFLFFLLSLGSLFDIRFAVSCRKIFLWSSTQKQTWLLSRILRIIVRPTRLIFSSLKLSYKYHIEVLYFRKEQIFILRAPKIYSSWK